jgi:hypothetical protein
MRVEESTGNFGGRGFYATLREFKSVATESWLSALRLFVDMSAQGFYEELGGG